MVCLHVCISRPGVGFREHPPCGVRVELPSVFSVGVVGLPVALFLGSVYVPYGAETPEVSLLGVVRATVETLWDV